MKDSRNISFSDTLQPGAPFMQAVPFREMFQQLISMCERGRQATPL
jgi:hypothetical protein